MRRNSLFTLVLTGGELLLHIPMPARAQSQSTPQSGGTPMGEQQPRTSPSTGTMGPPNGPMKTGPMQMPEGGRQEIAKEAALGGMTEVEVGRVAQEKSSSEAVKEFGKSWSRTTQRRTSVQAGCGAGRVDRSGQPGLETPKDSRQALETFG